MPDLSEDLSRLLRRAADDAPALRPDPEGVRRRHAHRRGTVSAVVAGVAVLALLVGAIGLVRVLDDDTPGVTAAASRPSLVALVKAHTRKVPLTLPDGREYTLEGLLPDGRLLVRTYGSFEKTDAFWALDPEANTATAVVRITDRREGRGFVQDVVVGDRWVAWYISYLDDETTARASEIWVMSTTALKPRRVVEFPRGDGVRQASLDVSGDLLHWSGIDGSLREVSLPDGEARTLPATRDYRVVSWPWLGTPAPLTRTSTGRIIFGSLWNYRTGERRTAHLPVTPGQAIGACTVSWCAYRSGKVMVSRFDGGAARALPDVSTGLDIGQDSGILRDRYLLAQTDLGTARSKLVLYDLQEKEQVALASVATGADGNEGSSGHGTDQFVVWPDDNRTPTTYLLLDLAALD